MMSGLEIKVGNLLGIPTNEAKFIVCKTDIKNLLVFYSAPLCDEFQLHRDIARYNNIPHRNVLGGGKMKFEQHVLKFYDYSYDFGAIPREIVERLGEVVKEYISVNYSTNKIKINTQQFYCSKRNAKYWKNWGFKLK